jgi:hypothetical protein
MENVLAGQSSPVPPTKKTAARAALVDLKDPARQTLSDCFRQFGVEAVVLTGDVGGRLAREKFEACVLQLGGDAQPVMEAARMSPSNSRIVLYGIGGSAQDLMRFSKYGLNAIFNEPLERPAALKLVRATQMLVTHEFRRYIRIPVITQVSMSLPAGSRWTATSREISSGGMSLTSAEDVAPGLAVEVSFALLTLPRIWVRGTVTWRQGKSFGVRFDPLDERRARIKSWIDGYLEA